MDALQQSTLSSGATRVATVVWMGYQAPATISDATLDHCERTATSLPSFLNGLRVTHIGAKSLTTVTGHSYGATTLSLTASRTPLDADQLVFLASPGAGKNVTSSRHLKLVGIPSDSMPRRVFSTASAADPVADTPGFIWPNDPTHQSFQDQTFYTEAHPTIMPDLELPFFNFHDHSSYWDKGSLALLEQGQIGAGRSDRIQLVAN